MYISTQYEIGDIVAIPYTVPTPGAGTTQGIIPGEIRTIKIRETVNDGGETVTVIVYSVIVDAVNLAADDFDEVHVLCKIVDYKTPYLEKMAESAGFVTEKMERVIRIANEKAEEERERAEEEREDERKARTAEAALSDIDPELALLTKPLQACSCTVEELDSDCVRHGIGR